MAPRGVSREEKRKRLLDLFHETSEFFTLKELEKIAPKQKGIIQQSVKEILDELVSDHLVCFDKIGTSNYYWSFPSAVGAVKQATLAKLKAEEEALDSRLTAAREGVASARALREETAERCALLAQLEAATAESAKLQEQVKEAGDGDPAAYARKRAAIEVAKTAAVRWTDNTVAIMGYCKSMCTDEAEMRQFLEIDDEWDDLDTTV